MRNQPAPLAALQGLPELGARAQALVPAQTLSARQEVRHTLLSLIAHTPRRGIEKPAFDLPDFIKKTGIMELRGAGQEKDAASRLKSKTRERTQGSGMGKIDIDYNALRDAFFVHQTKSKLTVYGDIYYEGKEFEVEMHEKRPGVLSPELREALGIPEGAPPPWLLAMQRFGPPPSYPNLRLPGLNAPLGDEQHAREEAPPPVDLVHWGDLPPEAHEAREDSSEEESAEEAPAAAIADGAASVLSGLETPLSGVSTPMHADGALRKRQLYEVLHESAAEVGGSIMASEKVYSRGEKVDLIKSQRQEAVELALAPEEIGKLSEDQLKKRYEKAVQERGQGTKRKDRDSDDEDAPTNKKKRGFKF